MFVVPISVVFFPFPLFNVPALNIFQDHMVVYNNQFVTNVGLEIIVSIVVNGYDGFYSMLKAIGTAEVLVHGGGVCLGIHFLGGMWLMRL